MPRGDFLDRMFEHDRVVGGPNSFAVVNIDLELAGSVLAVRCLDVDTVS